VSTAAAAAVLPAPAILAAVLTPFVPATEDLDTAALQAEIDWLVANGAGAVVAGGVETQEYQVFEGDRRTELVDRTLQSVDGRCPTIVGVTHPSPARSRALAAAAARSGATAVMTLVGLKPWGAPPTAREVADQVAAVADASGLPVVVYCNPRMGVDLPVDAMAALAELPEVCAFKETSRDIGKIGRLLAEIDQAGTARVYTTMEALLTTLLMGGPGAMMPPPAVAVGAAIVAAVGAGDIRKAADLQRVFSTFPGRWMHLGLTPVMKAAMRVAGVDVGSPVPPFEALGDVDVDAMAEALSASGALDATVGAGPVADGGGA
jgi:4-hydroxy-tetrahydrodipicolinate synthase